MKKRKKIAQEKYNVPENQIRKLRDYMIKLQEKGISKKRIKSELASAGWPEELIREQFGRLM